MATKARQFCLVCKMPVAVERPQDRVCPKCASTDRGKAVLAEVAPTS